MYISLGVPRTHLQLNTDLEAVAVQLYFSRRCTLCSLYPHPEEVFS